MYLKLLLVIIITYCMPNWNITGYEVLLVVVCLLFMKLFSICLCFFDVLHIKGSNVQGLLWTWFVDQFQCSAYLKHHILYCLWYQICLMFLITVCLIKCNLHLIILKCMKAWKVLNIIIIINITIIMCCCSVVEKGRIADKPTHQMKVNMNITCWASVFLRMWMVEN